MKERPILFSGSMVRAILAGRKTQTRRALKPQPDGGIQRAVVGVLNGKGNPLMCRHGQPGDRLWVREKWRVGAWSGPAHSRSCQHWIAVDYAADGYVRREWLQCPKEKWLTLREQSIADATKAGLRPDKHDCYGWEPGHSPCRWRPSIHMPRWASRLTLRLKEVRVERLQDISVADAIAEGIHREPHEWRDPEYPLPNVAYRSKAGAEWRYSDPREAFQELWESISGPASWDANPWVWVVEFKCMELKQ